MLKIAHLEDLDEIILFIKKHWGKNHILADPNFVKYYYFNILNDRPTGEIIIYKQKNKREISALFGSIIGNSNGQSTNAMLWRSEKFGAGLVVMDEYIRKNRNKDISGVGAQKITIHLLKNKYGFVTGRFNHQIKKITENSTKEINSEIGHEINLYRTITEERINLNIEADYLKWKFLHNPYMDYVYGLCKDKLVKLIFRIIWVNKNNRALRLIYSEGDISTNLQRAELSMTKFCIFHKLNYIDIWSSEKVSNKKYEDKISVIDEYPLYTMPPYSTGNELLYFSNTKDQLYLCNGDQDRPNIE